MRRLGPQNLPLEGPRKIAAFLDKVLVGIEDHWIWFGAHTVKGYGRVLELGTAHRVSYELFVGPIPEGLEIDHLCKIKSCVNPNHLEPVTHPENVRRGRR